MQFPDLVSTEGQYQASRGFLRADARMLKRNGRKVHIAAISHNSQNACLQF